MTPLLFPGVDWNQILVPLLGFLLPAGGVTAWVSWRHQKKMEPIDSATAVVAMSESAGKMALAIASRQDSDIVKLRKDMDAMSKTLASTAEKLAVKSDLLDKTRFEISTLFHGFRNWYDNKIVAHWETVRQQPVPPDPPIELSNTSGYSSMLNDGQNRS